MEEDFTFKLIQSVDPTKIRVPLKEKFAKLTLSSNKKKEQVDENEAPPQQANIKRQSASRNLMRSFLKDDEGRQNDKKNTSAHMKPVNPLLQSDSSGTNDNDNSALRVEGKFKEWEDTGDSFDFMEPLQLSISLTQTQDDALEELSRRISSIVVGGPPALNDLQRTPHKLTTPQRGEISNKLCTPQKTPQSAISSDGKLATPQSAQNRTTVPNTSTPQRSYFEAQLKSPQNLTRVEPKLLVQKAPQISASVVQKSLRESSFSPKRPTTGDEYAESHLKTPTQQTSPREARAAENPLRTPQSTNSALHISASSDMVIVLSSPSNGSSYDDTTDDAITISDSSVDASAEITVDLEGVTSSILQSNSTGQSFLPSTFSNDKADRIEAFLRDVSQELKERIESGEQESDDEFHDASNVMPQVDVVKKERSLTREKQIANADTEPMSSQELSLSLEDYVRKAKKWATADTEPMTSEEFSESGVNEPNAPELSFKVREPLADTESMTSEEFGERSVNEPKTPEISVKVRKSLPDTEPMTPSEISEKGVVGLRETLAGLNDTESMSQTHTTLFGLESQDLHKANAVATAISNYDARFANDDTELNTMSSNMDAWQNSDVRPENSLVHGDSISLLSNSPPPSVLQEESIVISETSSEDNRPANTSANSAREIVVSEQTSKEEQSSLESQVSQMEVAMGRINISAKININIQVSHLDETESEASSSATSRSSPPLDREESADEEHDNEMPEQSSNDDSAQEKTDLNDYCAQKQQPTSDVPETESEEPRVDKHFLTNAERLLNKLYGTTWRTPEVIRTLKHTSTSGKKSLPKQQLSTETPKRTQKSRTPKKMAATKKKIESPEQQEEANKEHLPNATTRSGEQSILLDEFSIFRREIVKTNLDSTRIMTPKPTQAQTQFKVPKPSTSKPVYKTKRGRAVKERLQNLVDSDVSDADAPDITGNASSDEDFEPCKIKSMERAERAEVRNKSQESPLLDSNEIVYLDLTHDEVVVKEGEPTSPLANKDPIFKANLEELLRTCKPAEKPKLLFTTPAPKTKRKLFTPNIGWEDDHTPPTSGSTTPVRTPIDDYEREVHLSEPLPQFNIFNKPLEEFRGDPIFKPPPVKSVTPAGAKTRTPRGFGKTPKIAQKTPTTRIPDGRFRYGFLKSLEVYLDSSVCDPKALYYRDNFRTKKEQLSRLLYDLYNEQLFDNRLNVPLIWNKKLLNTAGRCLNRTKLGQRSSEIELSVKVLTSADRLRCTLIHELCHAAAWIFNGEGGHGKTWKGWAQKANHVFPELPKILVCHQYDIEYKYTYKCTLCGAKSHAHSKSKKVENIRCAFCHGAIEIFLNKKDKQGNVVPTPVKEPTGFAKFVKDNYKQYKRPELKHADVMKLLSNEFGALKLKATS